MDYITTTLAFLVTLGLLVTFHEYGHFQVARWCGVRVIRFSVGFGKPLFVWKGRTGTEYVLALIPLGGYVRMLDSRQDSVGADEAHEDFSKKPVLQRFAVVAAGPIANLIFAVAAFWLMFVTGFAGLAPVVGDVEQGSIADHAGLMAGDEIVQVGGYPVQLWSDIELGLIDYAGEEKNAQIDLLDGQVLSLSLKEVVPDRSGITPHLGLVPLRPDLPAIAGEILPGSPAEQAGFETGDVVLSVDTVSVASWYDWVELVQAAPGQQLEVVVSRNGVEQVLKVVPDSHSNGDMVVGRVGMGLGAEASMPEGAVRNVSYGVIEAFSRAVQKTADFTWLTFSSIGKMVTGALSLDNLGGPLTIANAAGASANAGLASFLNFLAIISISLAVLNLLPIPVLDGGHLMFYLYEIIRGKPLPEKVQIASLNVGMLIIMSLIGLSLFLDFSRFFG